MRFAFQISFEKPVLKVPRPLLATSKHSALPLRFNDEKAPPEETGQCDCCRHPGERWAPFSAWRARAAASTWPRLRPLSPPS
jgi:hypothetical protein